MAELLALVEAELETEADRFLGKQCMFGFFGKQEDGQVTSLFCNFAFFTFCIVLILVSLWLMR